MHIKLKLLSNLKVNLICTIKKQVCIFIAKYKGVITLRIFMLLINHLYIMSKKILFNVI